MYVDSYESELKTFFKSIEVLSKILPSSYFLTRASLLQNACELKKNRNMSSNSDSTLCWCCASNPPEQVFLPCKHRFCGNCVKTLKTISPEQTPVNLALLLNDSVSLNLTPTNKYTHNKLTKYTKYTLKKQSEETMEMDLALSASQCPLCLSMVTRVINIADELVDFSALQRRFIALLDPPTQMQFQKVISQQQALFNNNSNSTTTTDTTPLTIENNVNSNPFSIVSSSSPNSMIVNTGSNKSSPNSIQQHQQQPPKKK